MTQPEEAIDTKKEVSMRMEVEVTVVVEADYATEQELLAWLADKTNFASVVGLTVSYMEANGTSDFLSTWLDENREVYLKEIVEVDLLKILTTKVLDNR